MVLTAPTQERMARLSSPRWQVIQQDGLPAERRSPILVLTGPGAAQLRWSRRTHYHHYAKRKCHCSTGIWHL